jgi:glycerol-3-phosphate acyltransferase PlsY
MNDAASIAIALVAAYLLGSFPTAYIFGRLRKGVDIRKVGTHNMGAMNVIYNVGIAYGVLVLIIDAAKGIAAIILARWLGVPLEPFPVELVAGGMAVIGHIFPVFLRFRGGRGGAVCVGLFCFLMPWGIPYGAGIFLLLLLVTRFPTLSYSLGLCCFPFAAWLIYHSGALIVFSVIMLMILLAGYVPRIKEMRTTGGSWKRVLHRRNLKDRF